MKRLVRIRAVLDAQTCDECRRHDGLVKDEEVAIEALSMCENTDENGFPTCRCTMEPYRP